MLQLQMQQMQLQQLLQLNPAAATALGSQQMPVQFPPMQMPMLGYPP